MENLLKHYTTMKYNLQFHKCTLFTNKLIITKKHPFLEGIFGFKTKGET